MFPRVPETVIPGPVRSRRGFLTASLASILTGRVLQATAGQLPSGTPAKSQPRDVPWLDEVTRFSPERVAAAGLPDPPQASLGANGASPADSAAWNELRPEIVRRWQQFLGPSPATPNGDPQPEVLEVESTPTHSRRKVRWEVEPRVFLDAWILIPTGTPPAEGWPAIIALHQTTARTIDEIAGAGPGGRNSQSRGLDLVEHGFVTVCPKNFLWQDAPSLDEATRRWAARAPGSRGMRKMLWDASRAIDLLRFSGLPINEKRIGCFGHSLGAKEVLYLMAFDERVKAGVASDGGVPFRSTNWNAPWYLGEKVLEDAAASGLGHHQLLALASPRPLLIVAGGEQHGGADGEKGLPLLEAARPAWRQPGEPARLGLWNHGEGHSLSDRVWARCQEWLKAYV
jgi:dienelactone hydrolase